MLLPGGVFSKTLVISAICLRACYAMPGTDLVYDARLQEAQKKLRHCWYKLEGCRHAHVLRGARVSKYASFLRAHSAMPGTDKGYDGTTSADARATHCLVLTWRATRLALRKSHTRRSHWQVVLCSQDAAARCPVLTCAAATECPVPTYAAGTRCLVLT
eukprot:3847796-Rhodomonas_salina.4